MNRHHDQRRTQRAWVRPLVRYVDEDQAIIDTHVFIRRDKLDELGRRSRNTPLDALIKLEGPDGRAVERRLKVEPDALTGMLRFELHTPQRWWPAGMGEQALYELTVTLMVGDQPLDTWHTTIGLTSVRPSASRTEDQPTLLVNGRERTIGHVLPVHPIDETQVLPVTGDCLLIVQDHFAPDALFDAADRAGILMIQSVPPVQVDPRVDLRAQVDRLAGHPSLVGWLVPEPDDVGDQIAGSIHALDPTRKIFRQFPLAG